MRNIVIITFMLLASLPAFRSVAFAQRESAVPKPGIEVPLVTPGPGWKACPRCINDGYAAEARKLAKVDTRPFDAHDISGVWSGDLTDLGANGTPLDMSAAPPFTPYGQKLYDATISDSAEWTSKDPMNLCDPMGFPRSYTYNYGIEFIQLPGRTLELFEQGHFWRTIYTDGRKLPPNPPIPRFFGYAVGRWEGDTFIVESNGYDDRSWIVGDNGKRNPQKRQAGYPHSDEMRIVERYKRLNYGLLQAELTIMDPKVYTAPWNSGPNVITLSPESEMAEHPCVPSDQIDFNNRNTTPALSTTK
jgi:hypothetical protein